MMEKMLLQPLVHAIIWLAVTAFALLIQIWTALNRFKGNDEPIADRYDYVIVGGGSAGSVLAGRLSENPGVSVLLVEAGGEGHSLLNIPVLGPLKQLSAMDWQYVTVPQKNSCHGLADNVSRWPSGKILGGSTHLNYMIYHRGHKRDYATWKDPQSRHWDDDDIQYYFDKAVAMFGRKESEERDRVSVRNSPYSTGLADAVLDGASELGHEVHLEHSHLGTGFTRPKLHMTNAGARWTSDLFVRGARTEKRNLHVLTNSVAEEVLFLDGFEAYGVRIRRGESEEKVVHANMEIILSAGSIGSPKLLMLSGIGPRDVLENAKVSVKHELPVGKNLQDHVTTGLDLGILKNEVFSVGDLLAPRSAFEYLVSGKGPFTSCLVDIIGVVHSSLVDAQTSSPDLEFMVLLAGVSWDKGVLSRRAMGISQEVIIRRYEEVEGDAREPINEPFVFAWAFEAWEGYFRRLTNESVISVLPVLLHPKSRGEIRLDPENPRGMPIIEPRYLSNEADVTTLVEGVRIAENLLKTRALRKFGVRFNDEIFPGCGAWEFGSDEYWRCYVRHLTLTVYHPAGTCKMAGLKDDGVVDHRLRVHGTNKLRVIDASVMPTLPSANPVAAVIMIAEKGADMIREDFHGRFSLCRNLDPFLLPRGG